MTNCTFPEGKCGFLQSASNSGYRIHELLQLHKEKRISLVREGRSQGQQDTGQFTSRGIGVSEIPTPFEDVSETRKYGYFSMTSLCGGVPYQVGVTWPIALSDCIGRPGAEYGLVIWRVFCSFNTFGKWPLTRYLFFNVKSTSVPLPLRSNSDSCAITFARQAGEASSPQGQWGQLTEEDTGSLSSALEIT